MHAFFWNDTTKEQDVVILVQTIFAGDFLCRSQLFAFYAVGDEPGITPIRVLEVFLHVPAEHNDLVRALGRGTFAELQIRGGEPSPLGTLPVEAMDSGNGTNSRPMRQSEHHTRPFGMVVNHIRLRCNRLQRGEEG